MERSGLVFADTFKIYDGGHMVEAALTSTQYPASGSYIDVSKCERFHVLIHLGTIADALVFKIKQTNAANGTLADINTTNCQHTIATNDDGEWVAFTIETDTLTDGNTYVTCDVSGVSGSNYAEILFLLPERDVPVDQVDATLPDASQYVYATTAS